ncbi:MAG: tetratricopeptide repeat protein [Gemmatimonadaceae bacterium]|nr:tetratricopeptide repeat protein [Gemmatimonadaceae bacterium]
MVTPLLDACLAALGADDFDIAALRNSSGGWKMPFESFMEAFIEHDKNTTLFGLFLLGMPNRNHYLIKKLASTNRLAVVATTNFDVLIERALADLPNRTFRIVLEHQSTQAYSKNEAELPLLKLHGTADDPATIRSTIQSITAGDAFSRRQSLVRSVIANSRLLWVWGYSCSDVLDISPAIAASLNDTTEVVLTQHDASVDKLDQALVLPLSVLSESHPFSKFKGYCVRVDSTLLREKIFGDGQIQDTEPIETGEWIAYVRLWIDSFAYPHICFSILCHLFYMAAEYEVALKYNSLTLDASRNTDPRGEGAALSNRGMILFKLNDHVGASEAFQAALEIFSRIVFHFGIVTSYNNIGYLLGHRRRFPEAHAALREGFEYVAANSFPEERLCEGYLRKSQGELYVLDSKLNEADSSYDLALKLFRDGYKAEESEVLMLKAKLRGISLRYEEAMALLQEAEDVATSVGNREVLEACIHLRNEFAP